MKNMVPTAPCTYILASKMPSPAFGYILVPDACQANGMDAHGQRAVIECYVIDRRLQLADLFSDAADSGKTPWLNRRAAN